MMNAEGLQSSLQRSLAWRKREITSIIFAAKRCKSERSYVVRGGMVLLYSHWEGFLRESVNHYLDYVFSTAPKIRELNPYFVAIALYSDVISAAGCHYPGSEHHHLKLARRVLLGTETSCTRTGWTPETKGDAGTQTYSRLMCSIGINPDLGMDTATWVATKIFIDEHLARDRHKIAHGEGLGVEPSEFLSRSARLTTLMERLLDTLVEAAESQRHLQSH